MKKMKLLNNKRSAVSSFAEETTAIIAQCISLLRVIFFFFLT
jgi:hypothetical protein